MINTNINFTGSELQAIERAYAGISFSPEKRAQSLKDGYSETLNSIAEFIEKNIKDEKQRDIAQETFDRLKAGYHKRFMAHVNAKGRCYSTMITGSANFNTSRNDKANASEHKKLEELIGYCNNMEKYALKSLNSVYTSAEKQETELERVKDKLAGLKISHELMKKANVIIRKYKDYDTRLKEIIALGYNEKAAQEILKPDYMDRVGFASFSLQNNNANIKGTEKRLKELEAKAEAENQTDIRGQLTIVRNFEEDRLQLIFDEKPNEETRKLLKRHAFRWSPRFGAWQRKLTNNAWFTFKQYVLFSDEIKYYTD